MDTSAQLAKAIVLQKQEYAFDRLIQMQCYDVDTDEENQLICDLKYLYMYYHYLDGADLTSEAITEILYKLYDFESSSTPLDIILGITIDTIIGIPDFDGFTGMTNIDLSAYVNKNSDIGAGIIYDATIDKIRLDTDTPTLVSPTIIKGSFKFDEVTVPTAIWELYNNDGTTPQATQHKNDKNLIVAKGSKALTSLKYSYQQAGNGEENPTAISGTFGLTLLAPNTFSDDYTNDGNFIETDKEITVNLFSPKQGLVVIGDNVYPATGTNQTSDTFSISFKDVCYFGISTELTLDEQAILSLSNKVLKDSKDLEIENITTAVDEYFYYCYPSSYGNLTDILFDKLVPVLGAFTKLGTLQITTEAGISETLNIYRTNTPGAFTDNDLKFI